MSTVYIDYIHGEPELDLKLEINGNNITAQYISHNDYGGYFSSGDISANISAGGIGFTLNSGTFSFDTSGIVIASASGEVGNGQISVSLTCTGPGSGCYDSATLRYPSFNSSKSDIDSSKVTIQDVGPNYQDIHLNNTLVVNINIDTPPSNITFSGTYIEREMSTSWDLGTGDFISFTVKPKPTQQGDIIATYNKNKGIWNFSDLEILTIYNYLNNNNISFPNNIIYLDLTVTTSAGSTNDVFPIEVGGTSYVKVNGNWQKSVPYKTDIKKPCIMYTKINGVWKRGIP